MLLGSAIAFLLLTLPTEINDIIRIHSDEKPVTEKAYLLSAILSALAHLNYAVRSFFSWIIYLRFSFLGPLLYLYINR
jgi:membrane protein CcdC involved in cytochrome C biogenesis